MKMMRYFATVLVLFVSLIGKAGIEEYSERIEGSSITGGTYEVYDDKYFEMSVDPVWFANFTNYKVSNYVRLGINSKVVQDVDNVGSIDVEITYHTWDAVNSVFVPTVVIQTLSTEYLIDGFEVVKDQSTYKFEDAHYVSVRVISISVGLDVSKLFLESGIEVERYYTMHNLQVTGLSATPIPLGFGFSNANNEFIEINWPYHYGAESYELEWVHINDYTTVQGVYLPQSLLIFDYYLNSTRIELTKNSYHIPNIFDHGYLIYRIRPIGRTGTNYEDRLDGGWTSPESGIIDADHSLSNIIYLDREYDSGMNWSHQVAYTEGGKRLESVSFIDGLGRGRQSVARNTSTDQVVVSNVYYDELGRAVINDLPTPQDQTYPEHFMNFNLADDGLFTPYNVEVFDLTTGGGICDLDSRGMSTTSGASEYYSPENTDQNGGNANIPDAEKFPFTRMTYRDDFTGRIDRMASAGNNLKMGVGQEVRMMYVSPDQGELNRLFGVEVGYASHYQKMIIVDENGQVYVQYSDMGGRIVATYMTGPSPTNLTSLDNISTPQEYEFELLGSGQEQGISSTPPSATLTYTRYFPESSEDYDFTYSFTPQQYQELCMVNPTCFDCVYDLSISIVEECGDVVNIPNSTIILDGGALDGLCNGDYSSEIPKMFTVTIPRGLYTITKTLTVNQDAIDDYWCLYIDNLETTPECLPGVSEHFNEAYLDANFAGCSPILLTTTTGATNCDIRRDLMLNDVSPGGQYGFYDVSAGGSYSVSDPTSVLLNWPSGTYLLNGLPYVPVDLEDFIVNFQPDWAEELLPFHPEYCYVQSGGYCDQNSASYAYDQAMLDTYDYTDACNAGYILPLGFIPTVPSTSIVDNCVTSPLDPFFDIGGWGDVYNLDVPMTNALNQMIQIGGQNVNIWYYTMAIITNPNATTYAEIENAYTTFIALNSGDEACDLDRLWTQFRVVYLQLKQQYYLDAEQAYAAVNCLGLPQIGTGAGLYANKVPIFPSDAYILAQVNQTSTNYGSGTTVTNVNNQSQMTGVATAVLNNQCQTACQEYAQEWLDQLSGCNIDPADEPALLAAFESLCISGCDQEHPAGTSTPVPGSLDPTIQEILLAEGYPESTLCTELLISEPAPYDNILTTIDQIQVPLDICACDEIYQAELDLANNVYPGVTTIEEVLALNTGVNLPDIDYLMCDCDRQLELDGGSWTPGFNWSIAPGVSVNVNVHYEIPADLGCPESQGCIDCTTLLPYLDALHTRFGFNDVSLTTHENLEIFLTEQNAELILGNYLNDELNFHLNYSTYIDFING